MVKDAKSLLTMKRVIIMKSHNYMHAGGGQQPAAVGGQRGEGHDEGGDISEADT
jgi:hypothetical protein